MAVRPYLVNGEWRTGDGSFEVHSPFDDSVVAEIGVPTEADVEEAAATAHETFKESSKLPIHARADALDHVSKRLGETIDENAELIAREGGKPLKWAKVEATRAVSTYRWASETIRHGDDEVMRRTPRLRSGPGSASCAGSRSARSWGSRRSTSR